LGRETLMVDGRAYDLTPNRVVDAGVGWRVYQAGGVELERRVTPGAVQYELRGLDWDPLPPCELHLRTQQGGLAEVYVFDAAHGMQASWSGQRQAA
jgi:hypothetical protein